MIKAAHCCPVEWKTQPSSETQQYKVLIKLLLQGSSAWGSIHSPAFHPLLGADRILSRHSTTFQHRDSAGKRTFEQRRQKHWRPSSSAEQHSECAPEPHFALLLMSKLKVSVYYVCIYTYTYVYVFKTKKQIRMIEPQGLPKIDRLFFLKKN